MSCPSQKWSSNGTGQNSKDAHNPGNMFSVCHLHGPLTLVICRERSYSLYPHACNDQRKSCQIRSFKVLSRNVTLVSGLCHFVRNRNLYSFPVVLCSHLCFLSPGLASLWSCPSYKSHFSQQIRVYGSYQGIQFIGFLLDVSYNHFKPRAWVRVNCNPLSFVTYYM